MNKAMLLCGSVIGLLFLYLPGVESEFIKEVTVKKSCPSKQESVELGADIVSLANTVSCQLNGLMKNVLSVQATEILEIQKYVDGDRDCVLYAGTKKERIALHEKKQKIKQKLDNLAAQLSQLVYEVAAL